MTSNYPSLPQRILFVSLLFGVVLCISAAFGLSLGSSRNSFQEMIRSVMGKETADPMISAIIWKIRLPRVLMAALVGAALALGGLVFQALLRNPLAEPYILGISGGSAIGAILGILMGLSRFPGVGLLAFLGSLSTLAMILLMASGKGMLKKDSLLLSGVMINAFCGAVIMFLVSITQDARLHNIIFWLMGDLSLADLHQVGILAALLIPCFALLFWLSHTMNLLLMGKEMAQSMGVNIVAATVYLLSITSFIVSVTVSHCGLLGFVGLVMPHLLRMLLGSDHRILVPACILGGGTYMILCDLLARSLPGQGEIPVGVITALFGAPLFIFLLLKSKT
ncbi:MAG: iron ABC transporter permease [Desulfobacterales bacterium CG07_land_8_20_14_0_80_52_14]|nr:MAG: ABC transporter permease [Desulfobacterales bacterium CG23_combo_of_CG06-09_8_20_14_all_52_9]PIU49393.1 MAG: iron ABC transporter permease [Desulfobacterales bacterium CG07_land_8_20_14_0_80_52_14]